MKSYAKDLTGQQFDRLLVVSESGRNNEGRITWLCRCKCGNEKIIISRNLLTGNTRSCGCLFREIVSKRGKDHPNFRHGESRDGNISPEFTSWSGMIQRCYYVNGHPYKNYGGRGITVCDR